MRCSDWLRNLRFNIILKLFAVWNESTNWLRDLRFNIILKPLHTIIPKHAWLKSL